MAKVYGVAESVEELAKTLIPNYHSELATAVIRYVFVDKASMKSGRPVLGKSRKLSGATEFLLESNFVVEVALDQWNDLTARQRSALVDHLLEYCTGEEDEEDAGAPMKWKIREPDVRELRTILQRHGAWNEDLSGFVYVARRIDVDSMIEASTDVAERTTTSTVE
jgi:hypothetical protein